MAELTKEQKRDYAKTLYLTERGITQKEIAERVGVTEATVSRWVRTLGWETMRTSLLTTKDEQLVLLYQLLSEINTSISERESGQRFASSKEADSILKLATAIGKLETETNIGAKMATGREFLTYLRATGEAELAKTTCVRFNAYIKAQLK